MNGFGDFTNVPDDEFRLILDYLTFTDIGRFRCVSKGIERRVTFLIKRLFNKFFIKGINYMNCDEISRTLSKAMVKLHAPKKLELTYSMGLFNLTMRQIFVDYRDFITSLDIYVKEIEELILQPTFLFNSLKSLTLRCIGSKNCAIEAMLAKHAKSLKNLKVKGLKSKLIVPALPILDSLALNYVNEDAILDFVESSRQSITSFSLGITATTINNSTKNIAVYNIPNLQNLSIRSFTAFNFAVLNADHIVSLNLRKVSDIPIDIIWPIFPKLRQIVIENDHLPLIINNRETIECLVTHYISNDAYAVEIPRLTDLLLIECNHEFSNKILNANKQSLEFLFWRFAGHSAVPDIIDDTIKLERMRKVVLYFKYNDNLRKTMENMCPNADVVFVNEEKELRNQMKSRFKRRNLIFE